MATKAKLPDTSMFSNAPVLPVKTPGKGKATDRTEIEVAGLEDYAAFDCVTKTIKGLCESNHSDLCDHIRDYFLKEAVKSKKLEESVTGIEGKAEANMGLRKRSSASVLKPEEIEILNEHDLPVETVTITEETFVINPKHAKDMTILSKLQKAVQSDKTLPTDLFLKQEGVTKAIVSDKTIETAFKTLGENALAEVIPMITTAAIRAKFKGTDKEAFMKIAEIMGLQFVESKEKVK